MAHTKKANLYYQETVILNGNYSWNLYNILTSQIIIISGTTARIGPWPPLKGFRDG
jgi:hypothetical protein